MRKDERQERILEQFRSNPSVRLASLADRFAVTKETIRRDIDELAARGLLARTYGGAVASPMNAEPGLAERELVNPDGRRRMARVGRRSARRLRHRDDRRGLDGGACLRGAGGGRCRAAAGRA